MTETETDWTGVWWWTHIAAVESQLEEVRRTVSNHVLERVIVQAKVLLRRERRQRERFWIYEC